MGKRIAAVVVAVAASAVFAMPAPAALTPDAQQPVVGNGGIDCTPGCAGHAIEETVKPIGLGELARVSIWVGSAAAATTLTLEIRQPLANGTGATPALATSSPVTFTSSFGGGWVDFDFPQPTLVTPGVSYVLAIPQPSGAEFNTTVVSGDAVTFGPATLSPLSLAYKTYLEPAPLDVEVTVPSGVVEGSQFDGRVATFVDPDASTTPNLASDYTATIAWGDGTTSTGTVTAGSGRTWDVAGSHTYADELTGTMTVSVTDSDGSTGAGSAEVSVGESDSATLFPCALTLAAGSSYTGPVAAFTDSGYPGQTAGDFTASVDWGDGTTSTGTVAASSDACGSGPGFEIDGTHTYAAGGSFAVHVTFSDDPPSSLSDVSIASTATVSDADLALAAGVDPAPVAATSSAGAPVTFTVPAASDEDEPVAVTCDHSPGDVFPVGTTTVTCTASDPDDANSPVSTTLTVTVVDDDLAIAPGVDPDPVTATGPGGAAVVFRVPSASDEDGPVAVTCDHAQGDVFAPGSTTVTCTATDPDDSNSPVSTTLTVVVVDDDLAIAAGVDPAPVPATGSGGANVTFTVPAATDEDGDVTVTCDHASGSLFPIGATVVTCTASETDDSNGPVSTTLTITVIDADLSIVAGVSPPATPATSPAGAVVTFVVPIATDEDGAVAVTCDHASGSMFAIGSTLVTCTATDEDDVSSPVSTTLVVEVAGAADQLSALHLAVQGVPPGRSLAAKLQAAGASLAAGDTADACSTLVAFIHEVTAQSGKKLPPALAAQLVVDAQRIRAVLVC